MTIFTVHLNYYTECDNYVPFCFITTALNNPSSDCFFLTSSCELAEKLENEAQSLGNTRIHCLPEQVIKQNVEKIDSIFFHDGINSKWFDLFSFARHEIVADFIRTSLQNESPETFITTDSDIAHYYDYSKRLAEPNSGEVFTRSPLHSYFAIWHKDTFDAYTDHATMARYFSHAEKVGGRCSDMHLLEWLIKEESLIKLAWNTDDYGIPLDTVRDFLYYSGFWIQRCDHSFDKAINDFPGGIWNDNLFLESFNSIDFWASFLTTYKSTNGKTELFLKRSQLVNAIKRLNGLVATDFLPTSPYVLYHKWVQDSVWGPYEALGGDLIRVPYVHFQGATKRHVPTFQKFSNGLRLMY
jgi:hypothetical protein